MKGDFKKAVVRLADGTRTMKEIAHLVGRDANLGSVYRVVRECGLQDMILAAYGADGIRSGYDRQRKALKAIIALDPRSPQGKLAAMGLERPK